MAWWKTAKVGDRIVCIKGSGLSPCGPVKPSDFPEAGRIYTIEDIFPEMMAVSGVGLVLAEKNPDFFTARRHSSRSTRHRRKPTAALLLSKTRSGRSVVGRTLE